MPLQTRGESWSSAFALLEGAGGFPWRRPVGSTEPAQDRYPLPWEGIPVTHRFQAGYASRLDFIVAVLHPAASAQLAKSRWSGLTEPALSYPKHAKQTKHRKTEKKIGNILVFQKKMTKVFPMRKVTMEISLRFLYGVAASEFSMWQGF